VLKAGRIEEDALKQDEAQQAGGRPEDLARDLEAMGPLFVKLGQLLSTRPDLLPQPYLDALARLHDNVEPVPYGEIETVVQEDLGVRMSKAFESFDPQPLASASLGQVHRATLRDGRPVVVKVQRPGIREVVLGDLDLLDDVAAALDRHSDLGRRHAFRELGEEFHKTLLRELDYRREAGNLKTLGANLASFERILVPQPVEDYTTSRVLTMDHVRGKKVTELHPIRRIELDGPGLAEDLCRAYLQQILVDGFFHADPHPGNVFVTDDERLALLDLGMVARLDPERRHALLRLVLAVSEGRGRDAAEIGAELGTRLEDFEE
jgi:predicted unusual protein kinase regulating ubiquinone biosynthesis (AarF/ABC1/UbiB family)